MGEKWDERAERLFGLVRELGNISEACKRMGLDRSVYYRFKKASAAEGKPSPGAEEAARRRAVSEEAVSRGLVLCLQYPDWGCDRLAHYLTLTGTPVSSPTVQKFLIRHGLGRVPQRMAEANRRAEHKRIEDAAVGAEGGGISNAKLSA